VRDSQIFSQKIGDGTTPKLRRFSGLTSQTIQVTLGLAVSQLVVAVAYVIGARATVPVELGLLVSAIAISSVAAGLVDFGLGAYLIREVAGGRTTNASMYVRLWQRLLSAGVGSALLLLAGVAAVALTDFSGKFVAWVALIFVSTLLMQSAQVPLRAHGYMGWVSLASLLDRLVFLLIVWALTSNGVSGEIAILFGLAAGLLVDSAFCYFLNCRLVSAGNSRLLVGRTTDWFGAWKGSRGYGFAAVLGSAQQLDVVVLGMAGGPGAAGSYGAVSRWTAPLLLPSTALTQVGMAHAPKADSTFLALLNFRRVAWIIVLAMSAAILVSIFSKPIADTILGPAYKDSAQIFAVLAASIIPTLFAQPLSMVLQSRGREDHVAWILGLGLAIRLTLCFALGLYYGGTAAAFAVLAQQTVILAILMGLVGRVLIHEHRANRGQ